MSLAGRDLELVIVRVLCLMILCAALYAAEPTRGTLTPAESIKLVPVSAPGLPQGVLSAVVMGDTTKDGIYVLRNRFPPNSTLTPHTHGSKWRIYTILEGEVRFGFGLKIDEASTVRLGPGGVATTGPTDMPHYFISGPEGAVLNVVAEGPFVTNFVARSPQASRVYAPRRIESLAPSFDRDGVKVYSISASGGPVDARAFLPQLAALKAGSVVDWSATPAFAIFHQGAELPYLVLAWWSNDNELFVRVAVQESGSWVVDAKRYSFCLWDMEIMWFERRSYIDTMYSGPPNLERYRAARMTKQLAGAQP